MIGSFALRGEAAPDWSDWRAAHDRYPMGVEREGQTVTLIPGSRERVPFREVAAGTKSQLLLRPLRISALAAMPLQLAEELIAVPGIEDVCNRNRSPATVMFDYPEKPFGVRVEPLLRRFDYADDERSVTSPFLFSGYVLCSAARTICDVFESDWAIDKAKGWGHAPGALWIEGVAISRRTIYLLVGS